MARSCGSRCRESHTAWVIQTASGPPRRASGRHVTGRERAQERRRTRTAPRTPARGSRTSPRGVARVRDRRCGIAAIVSTDPEDLTRAGRRPTGSRSSSGASVSAFSTSSALDCARRSSATRRLSSRPTRTWPPIISAVGRQVELRRVADAGRRPRELARRTATSPCGACARAARAWRRWRRARRARTGCAAGSRRAPRRPGGAGCRGGRRRRPRTRAWCRPRGTARTAAWMSANVLRNT